MFKVLPLMSIYQNGVGNTKYGLSYVVPDSIYFELLEPASRKFLETELNTKTLSEIEALLFNNEPGQNNFIKPEYSKEILKASQTDKQLNEEVPALEAQVVNNGQGMTFGAEPATQEQAPVSEVKKKELFTYEKGETKKSFRGKTLNFVDKITTKKDTIVAMSNNKETKVISIDKNAMTQKFNDKAWTKPSKQLDGSYATPLFENEFNTADEWLTFALIHEVKHDTIFKEEGETTGQYEDRINQAALEDLKQNYNVESVSKTTEEEMPEEPEINKDINVFNSEIERLGKMPKDFMAGNRKWILNNMNLYDLVDEATGDMYLRDMNMFTGEVQEETTSNKPVNPKQLYNFTRQIISGIKQYKLNDLLIAKGIKTDDVFELLKKVNTQSELNKIINKILKAIC